MADIDGAEALLTAHTLITQDRNETYDHPVEDYTKVADIFYGLTGIPLSVQQALCFPLAMKLARMRTHRNRGTWHDDSLIDAIGYLGCMSMAHRKGHDA